MADNSAESRTTVSAPPDHESAEDVQEMRPRTRLPFIQRDIAELRKMLSTICHFVWHRELRPGEHLWSIPVDNRRDFDCMFSDAFDELERLRAQAPAVSPDREALYAELEDRLRQVKAIDPQAETDLLTEATMVISGLRGEQKATDRAIELVSKAVLGVESKNVPNIVAAAERLRVAPAVSTLLEKLADEMDSMARVAGQASVESLDMMAAQADARFAEHCTKWAKSLRASLQRRSGEAK